MKDPKNLVIVLLLVAVAFLAYQSRQNTALLEAELRQLRTAPAAYPPPRAGKEGNRPDPYIAGAVKNTIRKRVGRLQEIYFAYLETDPEKTDGNVEIDWQIDPRGKVLSPEIIASEIGDETMKKDLVKTIAGWEFPPPPSGRTRYIVHTFTFKKEAEETAEQKATDAK